MRLEWHRTTSFCGMTLAPHSICKSLQLPKHHFLMFRQTNVVQTSNNKTWFYSSSNFVSGEIHSSFLNTNLISPDFPTNVAPHETKPKCEETPGLARNKRAPARQESEQDSTTHEDEGRCGLNTHPRWTSLPKYLGWPLWILEAKHGDINHLHSPRASTCRCFELCKFFMIASTAHLHTNVDMISEENQIQNAYTLSQS